MSLVTGLAREYLVDDYTICFLICCCFLVLASVTSGCFYALDDHWHSLAICVLKYTKTIPPRDGALAGKGPSPCCTSTQAY